MARRLDEILKTEPNTNIVRLEYEGLADLAPLLPVLGVLPNLECVRTPVANRRARVCVCVGLTVRVACAGCWIYVATNWRLFRATCPPCAAFILCTCSRICSGANPACRCHV